MCGSKALEALFPGARRLVLSAIFREPNRWWSVAELAGRAGVRQASLSQQISHLRESGVVRESSENGLLKIQPDPACPIFAELHAIVTKLTSITDRGETILVAEDQTATAQITRILLESWGYRVLEAHRGREAIHIFEQHDGDVHLLLTDVTMPEMTGTQLARELVRRNPDLRVVFMSGYGNEDSPSEYRAFLQKPFNPSSLSQIIRKELDRRPFGAVRIKRH